MNTHALQLRLKKMKHQKLQNKLNVVEREIIPKNNIINQTLHDLQSTVNQYHYSQESHQILF